MTIPEAQKLLEAIRIYAAACRMAGRAKTQDEAIQAFKAEKIAHEKVTKLIWQDAYGLPSA